MVDPCRARRDRITSEGEGGDIFVYLTDDVERALKMTALMQDGHENAEQVDLAEPIGEAGHG
jgi:hypothetical protein